MRSLTLLLAILILAGLAIGSIVPAAFAAGGKSVRLAQSSTTTNCMVVCNSTAATCQASCVVPGAEPTGAATTTSNADASTSCLLNCSSEQLACQTDCARISPSQ